MADTPALGHKSYLQMGKESTAGTAVAATMRDGFISCAVTPDVGFVRSRTLTNAISRASVYPTSNIFRAKLLQEMDYQDAAGVLQLYLWDGIFGTASFGSKGAATTGAGPYAHTFKEKTYLQTWTMELIEGDIPSGKCTRLVGAVVEGVTVRGQAGRSGSDGLVTVEWDIVAREWQSNQTPTGAISAPTLDAVLCHEVSVLDDGSSDSWTDPDSAQSTVMVKSFELVIRNRVDDQRHELGTKLPRVAVRNDFLEASMSYVKEYQTKTLHDQLIAGTTGNPKIVFGSTTSRRMTFDIDSAYITGYSHPVEGYGIIRQNVTWEPVTGADASAVVLLIETTNNMT